MTRLLEPATLVARYRIQTLLGAGGMGEVYLARDESLDRAVALKILPFDLVGNDERVRRFVQEAKSASSLNHPHIVTIYEIGESDIKAHAGMPAERIHFIAMELVVGHTLKTLIHQEKTDLRTLVRYLAQAADGLAKAHAAGIVHRDLKPENIMVTSDGFAKVLDFGLAKLTEKDGAATDLASAPTELAPGTGVGMVLGTVGYMSPEQVQGRAVDHRSDIFSLGCVLYEAATRRRPFQADSDVETLHQILKDAPPPIEELNPKVPGELRRVIRRCLAKSPERRVQSMKDVALDLGEIDEFYETLSLSSGSGATGSARGTRDLNQRSRLFAIAALVIGIAGFGFGVWQWMRDGDGHPPSATAATLEITTVARIPGMTAALMSADGRLLVFAREQGGRSSLVVRQLATNVDFPLIPPQDMQIWLVGLALDTSYVYYIVSTATASTVPLSLYRIPTLGGEPRQLMRVGAFEIALSPDGSRLVAVLDLGETRGYQLVIANADGTELRTLATEKGEISAPAWTTDGQHIVASVSRPGSSGTRWLAYRVSDGRERDVGASRGASRAAWLPDGSGFVAIAYGRSATNDQLWHISWPDGAARQITNDNNSYAGLLTVSPDSRTITTTHIPPPERAAWIAPANQPDQATRLIDVRGPIVPLRDNRILYGLIVRGQGTYWTMQADGSRRQRITPDGLRVNTGWVFAASNADVIVFRGTERVPWRPRLWRMDSNGGGLAEVPDSEGKSIRALSPDGLTMYYVKDNVDPTSVEQLWRRAVAGGKEERVGDLRKIDFPIFSPDGRLFYRVLGGTPTPGVPRQVEICDATDGRVLRTITLRSDQHGNRWAPSSDAVLFARTVDGVRNIWRLPINGQPEVQITRFGPDQFMGDFGYTTDGKQLIFFRNERTPGEVLQFRNFR